MKLIDAKDLRSAGRALPCPFELMLADGRRLIIKKVLRILPGKRITSIAIIEGQPVIAKLFFAKSGAPRHWERELRGLEALRLNGIPSPHLLASGSIVGNGHYLLTEYLSTARSPSPLAEDELLLVFRAVGEMHAQRLVHEDAHLDNFLIVAGKACVIDGDAIMANADPRTIYANLALLFSQLPPEIETAMHSRLLAVYRDAYDGLLPDPPALQEAICTARWRRLNDYLDKCLRDCSLFKVEQRWDRFVVTPRAEAEFLAPLVADPDRYIQSGIPLKLGHTATLAQVELDGRLLVIKRYNIKNIRHAISRSWRPSRAWHSWREAHRLRFLDIATPRPLALIEQRIGPLRGRAWLVTEYCAGPSLTEHPPAEMDPTAEEIAAIQNLFRALARWQITHGDMKSSNLLWSAGQIALVDLDAMRQHRKPQAYERAARKDRQRFLENWPQASPLRTLLARVISNNGNEKLGNK